MESLESKTCIPCQGGVKPLEGESLHALEQQLDSWNTMYMLPNNLEDKHLRAHHITKTYNFRNFRQASDFVSTISLTAEEQGHHPDIYLTWGKVAVTLWTRKIDGLTESDFILAAKIDRLYELHRPRSRRSYYF